MFCLSSTVAYGVESGLNNSKIFRFKALAMAEMFFKDGFLCPRSTPLRYVRCM